MQLLIQFHSSQALRNKNMCFLLVFYTLISKTMQCVLYLYRFWVDVHICCVCMIFKNHHIICTICYKKCWSEIYFRFNAPYKSKFVYRYTDIQGEEHISLIETVMVSGVKVSTMKKHILFHLIIFFIFQNDIFELMFIQNFWRATSQKLHKWSCSYPCAFSFF